MRRIDVKALVHREGNVVPVQSRISSRVVLRNDLTAEAGDELGEPAFALGGGGRTLGPVVAAVEMKGG